MAPEQAHDRGGRCARRCLCARAACSTSSAPVVAPIVAHSPVALVEMKRHAAPEPMRVRARALGLPAELDHVILRALSPSPMLRYASAGEFRHALEAVLEAPQRRRSISRVVGYALLAAAGLFGACLLGGGPPLDFAVGRLLGLARVASQ